MGRMVGIPTRYRGNMEYHGGQVGCAVGDWEGGVENEMSALPESGRYPTGRTIIVCSAVPQLPSLSKSIAWEIPIPLDCQNEIA